MATGIIKVDYGSITGGGGTGLISDFTSVECIGNSAKPVTFTNIPKTTDVIYAYFQKNGAFTVGQNYDLNALGAGTSYGIAGIIIIDSSGNVTSCCGGVEFTLSGSTLTCRYSGISAGYYFGLFMISE